MHIAFIGDLTVDVYTKQRRMRMGGAALNMAIWAKRLKAQAAIFSAVGTDKAGKKILTKIRTEGIAPDGVAQLEGITSTIDIITNEEGGKSYGPWNPGTLAQYHINDTERKVLARHRAVVLTVYPQIEHLLDELRPLSCKRRHPLIVVNFGDLGEFHKDMTIVQSGIDAVDVLFFGLDKDADEALINQLKDIALQTGKLIIVTLGRWGSLAYAGDRSFIQPPDLVKVKDTTGAGDAFLAGFLVSYLEKKSIQTALYKGSTLASQAITKLGAY